MERKKKDRLGLNMNSLLEKTCGSCLSCLRSEWHASRSFGSLTGRLLPLRVCDEIVDDALSSLTFYWPSERPSTQKVI